MSKDFLLKKAANYLDNFSEDTLQEVINFEEYLLYKQEEIDINEGIKRLNMQSESLKFLNEEEDLYTLEDVKNKL